MNVSFLKGDNVIQRDIRVDVTGVLKRITEGLLRKGRGYK